MEFELKDQYNSSYTYRFPKEKVSILALADRKGVSQVEGWIRPLYERYTDRVDIHGIAVVSSVPSMFRGLLRSVFKSRVKFPVMLDWEGEVTKSFGYSGGRANIFVIDKNGNIVLKLIGPATADGLEQVSAQVNNLLGG
jgi:hypothetical protein